ncbi:MAG TPA: DUF2336 domain-containing protein, partial [Reyranellaceae bacterium]|nr:DUF2336 domain-containing protein [Reyranellaceae bacterium]
MATVRRDFFLNPAERLTEQERALMTALLHGLVGQIADDLRAALPPGAAAANDDDNLQLVGELGAAGLLDRPRLIALLLRYADEERIATAVRARAEARHARFLQALVGDDDANVSAAAMALILARGRRRDRFGQPIVEFDDLPADTAVPLVHSVAAALRRHLLATSGAEAVDTQLGAAADQLVARHDRSKRVDGWIASLARVLDEAGRLDEALLEAAADEGDVAFLAEALSRRADIPSPAAWSQLIAGGNGRLMLLLRMAGMSRDFAARMLAGLGELLGI